MPPRGHTSLLIYPSLLHFRVIFYIFRKQIYWGFVVHVNWVRKLIVLPSKPWRLRKKMTFKFLLSHLKFYKVYSFTSCDILFFIAAQVSNHHCLEISSILGRFTVSSPENDYPVGNLWTKNFFLYKYQFLDVRRHYFPRTQQVSRLFIARHLSTQSLGPGGLLSGNSPFSSNSNHSSSRDFARVHITLNVTYGTAGLTGERSRRVPFLILYKYTGLAMRHERAKARHDFQRFTRFFGIELAWNGTIEIGMSNFYSFNQHLARISGIHFIFNFSE